MNMADRNFMTLSLTSVLQEWWDEEVQNSDDDLHLPIVGDDAFSCMATAAMAVLVALDDTQSYLKSEKMMTES